jgi:hypothetical protein
MAELAESRRGGFENMPTSDEGEISTRTAPLYFLLTFRLDIRFGSFINGLKFSDVEFESSSRR